MQQISEFHFIAQILNCEDIALKYLIFRQSLIATKHAY
jgi:hypothetical protein